MDDNNNKSKAASLPTTPSLSHIQHVSDVPLKILTDDNNNKRGTKKFSSILIKQLNETIHSTADIDVRVIPGDQYDKLIGNQSSYESIECQTDDVKFEKYLTELKPTFSDIESVGFYYFDSESNNYVISDDDELVIDQNLHDECIGYEVYNRKSYKKNSEPRSFLKYKVASTQTVLCILPEKNRSTQTSPSLLRDFLMNDLTHILSNVQYTCPSNEDYVNNIKNEQYEKQKLKSRSNSSIDSVKSLSENTSFERPLNENNEIKHAIVCRNDSDKLQKQKFQQTDSINSENNSFHTAGTHFTSTTTVPSENCSIYEPENFDFHKNIENYLIYDSFLNLNQTLSKSDSLEDQIEKNERHPAHSDRTSIISDVNSEDEIVKEEEDDNTAAGLLETEKLSTEFYNEALIEEKYIKDNYKIFYPQSDRIINAEQQATEILNESRPTETTSNDELKRKIKFNDELDIIDPSEYSTPTTSTSNLQQFLSSDSFQRIDCSTDESEISPSLSMPKSNENKRESFKYNHFSTFKWQASEKSSNYEKTPQLKSTVEMISKPQIIADWDSTPVKPYNSAIHKLDSNLEKTLNTFDLKESKKGVKYIEKYSNTNGKPSVFTSESLERRLRASGFNDLIINDDASRKAKPPIIPQQQKQQLRFLNPSSQNSESPESFSPPVLPINSPEFNNNLELLPERPPLPNLPLNSPLLPPRISQNTKFEIKDKPTFSVSKKFESFESLVDTLQSNKSSSDNSIIRHEAEHERNSNTSLKQTLIVDTIDETVISTSVVTEKIITNNIVDVVHSPLSLQNLQKRDSESLPINDSPSFDKKPLTIESKLTFDEPSFKKFDIDLTFYDEESVIINQEQTSYENFCHIEPEKIEKESLPPPKERQMSKESKILIDLNKPRFDIDFSVYDEFPKNNELITTSELTDVTTNTSRDYFSSFSNESKLLLNTSTNIQAIDVDFSIYEEQPKVTKTVIELNEERGNNMLDNIRSSLMAEVKDSKNLVINNQPIKEFEIKFDEYEKQPVPKVKQQQKGVLLSLSNSSLLADKTTSSDTTSTTVKKFEYDSIDIPKSKVTQTASLSTESNKLLIDNTKNIIKFDVDFSIYEQEQTKKELTKNSIIKIDKENIKKFDVDFDTYDENIRSLDSSMEESKRDQLKQIDNIVGNQSSYSNNKGQKIVNKKPTFDFPDWENMLHMVQHQDNQIIGKETDEDNSYNLNCSDPDDCNNDDDNDAAGTEADIDDNDDQDNDMREFELNNNRNGIINMVLEPVINHDHIFNEQKSYQQFTSERISPKKFDNDLEGQKKNENFDNFFPSNKLNQNYLPLTKFLSLNNKDENQKVCVSSVAPSYLLKPIEPIFTTHIERGEIQSAGENEAQFEVSGYTPTRQSQQNESILLSKLMKDSAKNRLKLIPNNFQDTNSEQRLRHKSGSSIADTSSISIEMSKDASLKETGKYIKNHSSGSKLTKIQKLMLSIADRERQKLLRRIERRKDRVPEILKLLKKADGKEKKKLEDELQLLLRKEEKDDQLKKKFNIDCVSIQQESNLSKVDSQEVLDYEVSDINTMKSSRSASATSLLHIPGSGSASGFSIASGILNDDYSSTGSKLHLTSIKGRESGYSSCDESGAEFRHRNRYSSFGSESRLEKVEDDYSTRYPDEQINENTKSSSILQTAIRSVVNRMPMDSSTLVTPSNARVLTKSPTLQIGYSNIQQRKIIFPPNSIFNPNSREYPQYEYEQPIELHSTELRPPINNLIKSVTSNRDIDKAPANGSNNESSANKNSTSAIRSKTQRDQNTNREISKDDDGDDEDQRKPTNNLQKSRIESEPIRIQRIDEEELGDNYELKYNVELDRQTRELIIMDYENNIKYVIVKKNDIKRMKNPTDPEPKTFDYMTRSALNNIIDFEIEYDDHTGEAYIQDRENRNRKWIILADDWDMVDDSDYISEEDVNLMDWPVFTEKGSNRKYIVDQRNSKKYFIVPKITQKDYENFCQKLSNLMSASTIITSAADTEGPISLNDRQSSASNFQVQWPQPPTNNFNSEVAPFQVNSPFNKTNSQKSHKSNTRELIVKDDPELLSQMRLDDQSLRIEYISEDQLGDNYELKYTVQLDNNTGDSFILDNNNNIKFIIMKKKFQKNQSSHETKPLVYEYIIRSVLDNIGGVEIEYDNTTYEPYIQDPLNVNRRWIVLSDDWDEVEGADYLSEEYVKSAKFNVFKEKHTNRKYIVDERDGKRYYVVPEINDLAVDRFLKKMSYKPTKPNSSTGSKKSLSLSDITQANFNYLADSNDETIKIAPENKKNQSKRVSELSIDYVEENDLETIDLQNMPIFQDPVTDESYIQDPQNNRIWIILPQNWQNLGIYIAEEEIDFSCTDVYEDDTKRKYVIDDKTGYRHYIVPLMNARPSLFKQKWPTLSKLVNKYDKVIWRKDFVKNSSSMKQKRTSPLETIENYDCEPRYASLDKSKSNLKLYSAPKSSRKDIPRALALPISPRPLHHLLLDGKFQQRTLNDMYAEMKRQEESLRSSSLSFSNQDWRHTKLRDDPTASGNQTLDRVKLADIEINGYKKERKLRGGSSLNSSYSISTPHLYNSAITNAPSASVYSYDSPFLHGVLTETFGTVENWRRNHRALKPKTRLFLKNQILATPRSQERNWRDTLEKSFKLKPRIIVINDDERILAANQNCKFYVQYLHDHDSILGADPAFLLMLPDRGPVNPTRPLMVSLKQLKDNDADIALREAPVFVYHQNGNAYFENIAQYLAGNYPKLSPKTVRKILQFKSLDEFEQYLEGKITRDEANRILESSGLETIDMESVKNELLISASARSPKSLATSEQSNYYHANCEYDSLRYDPNIITSLTSKHSEQLYETQEVEIDGILVKSTFVSLTPSGTTEQVVPEDLTPNLIEAIKKADEYEESKQYQKILINQNHYERNPIISPIMPSSQPPKHDKNWERNNVKKNNIINGSKTRSVIPFDERTNLLKSKYNKFTNQNQV